MKYTTQEWYTPAEIAVHNTRSDCWVSLHGKVLNLTPWLYEQSKTCKCLKSCNCDNKNWFCSESCTELCSCFKRGHRYCDAKRLAVAIVAYAGKDVSHWFNGDEWVKHTHAVTGLENTHKFFGLGTREPAVPSSRWRPVQQPWWLDQRYVVGKATAKTRPIRITNSLTSSTVTLEVCSEETIYQIMLRYEPHNTHLMSYTWRYHGLPLCPKKTLTENGIPDERDRFNAVGLPENLYIPNILLCYNDDLTEDPQRDDCSCRDFVCLTSKDLRCQKHTIKIVPPKQVNFDYIRFLCK